MLFHVENSIYMFNYIIPIFNKEDILPHVLDSLDKCASKNSKIFTILDGCVDRSEDIVDKFKKNSRRDVIKIYMPNVHMLRSVNEGLKRVQSGFSVIMQDDIIIEDKDFERKVADLYLKMGKRLGVVSLRLAANVASTPLLQRLKAGIISNMIREVDFIKNSDDSQNYSAGAEGLFYPRISAINGPNIIPWEVLDKVGLFDDALAPYGYDDPDYCLRSMKAGFVNGLFPLRFKSDISWGGTRRNKKFAQEARRVHFRNRKYLWSKHRSYIEWLWQSGRITNEINPVNSLLNIPDCSIGLHN
jgi:glycosyltransferase involved in cell wall biosynthesis